MNYIKQNYNNISASEIFCEYSNELKVKTNRLIITFDDGYENTLTLALPTLKKFSLQAICFVIPGLSLNIQLTWTDLLYEIFTNSPNLDLKDFGIDFVKYENDLIKSHEQAINIIYRSNY